MNETQLTFSDAVTAIDGKGPSTGGWYNGKCPAHEDSKASLGIKERPERADGTFAIKCQAGCTRKQVIAALKQKTGKTFGNKKTKEKHLPAERGITLEQYANLKCLPREYLTYFGTGEVIYQDKPAVAHTYFDAIRQADPPAEECSRDEALACLKSMGFVGAKYRLSTDSHDTVWVDHIKSVPYGLFHLQVLSEIRGKLPTWIVICEGESDMQTLFFNDVPALGISGKNGWQPEFAALPLLADVKEVFVIQEPEAEDFVEKVAASFQGKRISAVTLPVKDPSAMWIALCQMYESMEDRWKHFRLLLLNAFCKATLLADGFTNTDTGNAERLVEKYGAIFRYVVEAEIFYVWNDCIWQPNDTGEALLPHTKDIVRAIPNSKWQSASESAGKRKAMIAMSKGEIPVLAKAEQFDRHPMLLNVQNGTLDLETQTLRNFCREDFLTKQANVEYAPFAECPKFDAFLEYIFNGDQDTIHFILKALGYTLTGSVGETCFFICYGLGANGKTTLIEVMNQILGPDFARPAKFTTFVHSKSLSEKYELATFKGRRLITAVEPRKAGHLDEEVLKQITGGDQIMARDIYQKNVVYYPEFKLWLAMNNQPRIIGTDEGIWRRVRMIPFKMKITEEMKVKEFHKVLFADEGPGILNRLLDGGRDWKEEGLDMSGSVATATAAFRESQNVIQGFFDTCTLSGKRGWHAKSGDLYSKYKAWAEEVGEFVIRQNEFAEELERRGFDKRRVHEDGFHWFGITLKDSPVEAERGMFAESV